ncbi:hypothetical protein FHG87_018256 [Trinorchestia longiramus]|nr:hypothetical protein FHG87_018256 [Trinorchestia longiramus]
MAGGKSKKAGSLSMIECMTCKIWVDLDSCKGLTEMSESERNKLVLNCWMKKRWSPPFTRRGDRALQEIHLLDQGHTSPHER